MEIPREYSNIVEQDSQWTNGTELETLVWGSLVYSQVREMFKYRVLRGYLAQQIKLLKLYT